MTGQLITIGLVVAAGIAAYVSLRGTYASLEYSKAAYYERSRFADGFASLKRAPEGVRERLQAVTGVSVVETQIAEGALIPLESLTEPATGLVISIPTDQPPLLNRIEVTRGRMVREGRADEVVVLESFATANDLGPGDALPAIVNGTRQELRIVGTALSPEYVFPLPVAGMFADEAKFAALFMDRTVVASAFEMDGAFNAVSFRIQPGASITEVIDGIDRVLLPYGGIGAVPRAKQPSNYILEGELQQLQVMATATPLIFLGVAAFLLNVVLARLVLLQRGQIAALKALGYRDASIALHYVKLVSAIVLVGAVIGLAVGAWLGRELTELYTQYFRLPLLDYRLDVNVATVAVGVSLLAALVGALASARSIMRLPPAEAMRPPAPLNYERSVLERMGLYRWIGPSSRMVIREIERRPLRLILSSLGIAMAVAVVVVGRFSTDAINMLIDSQFHESWREDVTLTFRNPVPERDARTIAVLPGVRHLEGLRAVPVRFRVGHRERDSSLIGYPLDSEFRRVLNRDQEAQRIPARGVMLTETLADILQVGIGDDVEVHLQEGDRSRHVLRVSALVDESFGLQGHMNIDALDRLLGQEQLISMALLRVDPLRYPQIQDRLRDVPEVSGVTRKQALIDQFRTQSGDTMLIFSLIATLFAATIAIGVVYNNARVALSMRSRDLASLRVLGFTRAEISQVLIGELTVQVALAIPLGLAIGTWMAEAMMNSQDPEQYRLPTAISDQTYAFAAVVTLVAGAISAFLVRRKLDRLDLIGVLKTRE